MYFIFFMYIQVFRVLSRLVNTPGMFHSMVQSWRRKEPKLLAGATKKVTAPGQTQEIYTFLRSYPNKCMKS